MHRSMPCPASLRRPALAQALALIGLLIASEASPALADETKLLAYGRHLASECSSCHRIDGVDNGIPSITGWATPHFIETMGYYRSGARTNKVMISVAQSLDAEQVEALAAYYGALPKPARTK